ncbi:peptidase A24 [Marinomonas rhizomae]|uniref:Aspartyl protease n=1 Tax=Marinomonas rhizomae TaxID=491948 RepID=A0A366JG98_9GAMM|nr:pepsin-like aspartic protease [Marinomonas rhizomae]RBP85797.1 aspartyl protease [Marinomonas rhizomae]RNF75586.1 peptidase A24 [Marinomonas rhizomae]
MDKSLSVKNEKKGIVISLDRGPYQNNGASPWYAYVGLGTTAQALKFSFDTGSNFIWVTSSLCGSDTCHHYGDTEFVYDKSTSFSWISTKPINVDFGPWGSMQVQTGKDIFTLTPEALEKMENGLVSVSSDVYLAQSYEGSQFRELDWDGGIGIPSTMDLPDFSSVYRSYRGLTPGKEPETTSFHFFQSLVDQGVVNAKDPYVTFLTDNDRKVGQAAFGQLNQDYRESREYLFLPWEPYSIASVAYIWTSPLTSFSVGDEQLIKKGDSSVPTCFFSLDSGSSQFKGDPALMDDAFKLTSLYGKDVTIELGETDKNETGKLVIPSSIYDVFIEEGEGKGKTISQFAPLDGMNNLVLVGSVLMDYLYTVYEYKIVSDGSQRFITPVGMWIFNKLDGVKVITTEQDSVARIFHS